MMTTSLPGQHDDRPQQPTPTSLGQTPLHDQTAQRTGLPGTATPPTGRDFRPAPIPETGPLSEGSDSKADAAKQEASRLADEAKTSAANLGETVKDEARQVAAEAKDQARGLLDSAKQTADEQARAQHERAAGTARTLADDLHRLSNGEAPQSDLVATAASTLAKTANQAARFLENREPMDLLREVQGFARRNPMAFLAICAGVGLVAGRVTRGMVGNPDLPALGGGKDEQRPALESSAPAYGMGAAPLADSSYAGARFGEATIGGDAAMPAPEYRGPQVDGPQIEGAVQVPQGTAAGSPFDAPQHDVPGLPLREPRYGIPQQDEGQRR
ncbi:hypothetical protein USB125703_00110 [Pseudoclavibacter triregionum]|nr:hypothetical protein USB125703_00110 [Pseudoclavibacter triregionum]